MSSDGSETLPGAEAHQVAPFDFPPDQHVDEGLSFLSASSPLPPSFGKSHPSVQDLYPWWGSQWAHSIFLVWASPVTQTSQSHNITGIQMLIGPSVANPRPSLGGSILTLRAPSWLEAWAPGQYFQGTAIPPPCMEEAILEQTMRPQRLTHLGLQI